MASENAKRDDNRVTTLLGVTDDVSAELRRLLVDPTTGRLKVQATGTEGPTGYTGYTGAGNFTGRKNEEAEKEEKRLKIRSDIEKFRSLEDK